MSGRRVSNFARPRNVAPPHGVPPTRRKLTTRSPDAAVRKPSTPAQSAGGTMRAGWAAAKRVWWAWVRGWPHACGWRRMGGASVRSARELFG
eukprot:3430478-Prymnesium_polylepis.1